MSLKRGLRRLLKSPRGPAAKGTAAAVRTQAALSNKVSHSMFKISGDNDHKLHTTPE
jgi:hypothetical protein